MRFCPSSRLKCRWARSRGGRKVKAELQMGLFATKVKISFAVRKNEGRGAGFCNDPFWGLLSGERHRGRCRKPERDTQTAGLTIGDIDIDPIDLGNIADDGEADAGAGNAGV